MHATTHLAYARVVVADRVRAADHARLARTLRPARPRRTVAGAAAALARVVASEPR